MKVLVVVGTRPEVIKCAPVIRALREDPVHFDVEVCATAQHREMLDGTLSTFGIQPEHDLDLMTKGQSLFDVAARGLSRIGEVLADARPDLVLVQGDTTSTFVGALGAFYARVRVAHLEAGLRSFDRSAPYPEEMNRVLTSRVADYHFAPTESARAHLAAEGIERGVWVVGNTVIDQLHETLEHARSTGVGARAAEAFGIDPSRRLVLATLHRRESIGAPMARAARALRDVAEARSDIQIVCPVHPNPAVSSEVRGALAGAAGVVLTEPLDYTTFVWLLARAHVVVTDSGGVQEEAAALGKPALVLRDVTERLEGVELGAAKLLGTDRQALVRELTRLLDDDDAHRAMASKGSPYGDGRSSLRVRDVLVALSEGKAAS